MVKKQIVRCLQNKSPLDSININILVCKYSSKFGILECLNSHSCGPTHHSLNLQPDECKNFVIFLCIVACSIKVMPAGSKCSDGSTPQNPQCDFNVDLPVVGDLNRECFRDKGCISWKIVGDDIELTLSGKASNYVAVGFNIGDTNQPPLLKMSPADVVACWFDDSGEVHVHEYTNTNGYAVPTRTETSLYRKKSVEEKDGQITCTVTRPLLVPQNVKSQAFCQTGFGKQDLGDFDIGVIFAQGSKPSSPDSLPQHGAGQFDHKAINLLSGGIPTFRLTQLHWTLILGAIGWLFLLAYGFIFKHGLNRIARMRHLCWASKVYSGPNKCLGSWFWNISLAQLIVIIITTLYFVSLPFLLTSVSGGFNSIGPPPRIACKPSETTTAMPVTPCIVTIWGGSRQDCAAGNGVYNLGGFENIHPGGSKFITENCGNEVFDWLRNDNHRQGNEEDLKMGRDIKFRSYTAKYQSPAGKCSEPKKSYSDPVKVTPVFLQFLQVLTGTGAVTALLLGLALFPVARHSVLFLLLGLPFERMVEMHRWASRATLVAGIVHAIHHLYKAISTENVQFLLMWKQICGVASLCTMILMAILAWDTIRRKCFEVFLYPHQFLALAAVILAMLHAPQLTNVYLLGVPTLWYLADQFFRIYLGCRPYTISRMESIPGGVTKLTIKRGSSESLSSNMFKYEPGQYCWLMIPAISGLQYHPFSISSGPESEQSNSITFHIKNMGNGSFTHALNTKARAMAADLNSGLNNRVAVVGPYGSFGLNLKKYDILYLVAGGIGVTPMASTLEWILNLIDEKKIDSDAGLPNLKKVVFVWSARGTEPFNHWFPELLCRAVECDIIELALHNTLVGCKHLKNRTILVEEACSLSIICSLYLFCIFYCIFSRRSYMMIKP